MSFSFLRHKNRRDKIRNDYVRERESWAAPIVEKNGGKWD